MKYLSNKQILIAITGGIAAYKSAELVRLCIKSGATVRVVMTQAAKAFITPLTLQALSGHPVHDNLLDEQAEAAMGHIELARWADMVIVAPASANTLAELVQGKANQLLTAVCLATRAPIFIAPAMNQVMWQAPATQQNIQQLIQRGIMTIGPDSGEQACGDIGPGRMVEPSAILQALTDYFGQPLLAGRRVLITGGPTQEAIDPVRYISNHSSGKMAYALATAAAQAGAIVTLITGPTTLSAPERVTTIEVVTAEQMLQSVEQQLSAQDIFISAAAVADYRCAQVADQKIKKDAEQISLNLIKNPDILATMAAQYPEKMTIGFAAETQSVLEHAQQKLQRKQCDMIIANDVSSSDMGFNADDNQVIVMTKQQQTPLPCMRKTALAPMLIEFIANYYEEHYAKQHSTAENIE